MGRYTGESQLKTVPEGAQAEAKMQAMQDYNYQLFEGTQGIYR